MDHSVATVVSMRHHPRKKCLIVELVTRQGSFKVSATHRVAMVGQTGELTEARRAGELTVRDNVVVGTKKQKLTRVTQSEEWSELVSVSFCPDRSMEAFVVPSRGLQTRGESFPEEMDASLLLQVFSQVAADELHRAQPAAYED